VAIDTLRPTVIARTIVRTGGQFVGTGRSRDRVEDKGESCQETDELCVVGRAKQDRICS
jgi:hypothetical protein